MRLTDICPDLAHLPTRTSLQNCGSSAQELLSAGIRLADEGRYAEAIEHYDEALLKVPNAPEIWFCVANVFFELGRLDKAIKTFSVAIDIRPDYVEAWNNKGTAHLDNKEFIEARSCFTKAIELNPNEQRYKQNLKAVESLIALHAYLSKHPYELPNTVTPGEYLSLLQHHSRKMRLALSGARPHTYQELFETQMPDVLRYLQQHGVVTTWAQEEIPQDTARAHFEDMIQVLSLEQQAILKDETKLAVGELPTNSVNAEATLAPNGGRVILVRTGMMHFIYYVMKVVASRIVDFPTDGQETVPDNVSPLSVAGNLLKSVFTAYIAKDVPTHFNVALKPYQRIMAFALSSAAERFVICHELAHHVLGHLGTQGARSWNPSRELKADLLLHSQKQEFQADALGLKLVMAYSPGKEDIEYTGVDVFMQVASLLELFSESVRVSNTHPPFSDRLLRLREYVRSLCADDSSSDALLQISRGLERAFFTPLRAQMIRSE